jgi:hypothetical protein
LAPELPLVFGDIVGEVIGDGLHVLSSNGFYIKGRGRIKAFFPGCNTILRLKLEPVGPPLLKLAEFIGDKVKVNVVRKHFVFQLLFSNPEILKVPAALTGIVQKLVQDFYRNVFLHLVAEGQRKK